ncbi:MAG: hypothetical protein HC822_13565 [Oscillochloris sp.]|nr:hypothetical protein [Oscillochloris sp.]
MIASAVADEQAGITGAVNKLVIWLVDPARFPAIWIKAVEATLAHARRQVH